MIHHLGVFCHEVDEEVFNKNHEFVIKLIKACKNPIKKVVIYTLGECYDLVEFLKVNFGFLFYKVSTKAVKQYGDIWQTVYKK